MSMAATKEVFSGALKRCVEYPHLYRHYGGRGIEVCDDWLLGDGGRSGFDLFIRDLGIKPEGAILKRKDVDRSYAPGNFYWATNPKDRNRRTRRNLMVEYRGQMVAAAEAAEIAGNVVSGQLAATRIKRGWTTAVAVETPPLLSPRPLPRIHVFSRNFGFEGSDENRRLVAIVQADQEDTPVLLYKALDRLHPRVKRFVLAVADGAEVHEAAAESGIPKTLVESLLPRLRTFLAPLLGKRRSDFPTPSSEKAA